MIDFDSLWFNQTFLLITVQLVVFYYKLGLRMIAHPGSYFAVIWLYSVFSQNLLMTFDLALVIDDKSIMELNIFVFFTSLCFILWVFLKKNKEQYKMETQLNLNMPLFRRLIILTLIGSVILMFYTWYSLGVTSFNLAQIRDFNTRDKTNYFGTDANLFVSVLKYTQFFYPLISILSGYLLGKLYLLKKTILIEKKYLYYPLIIALVYVLTSGGRNPLFEGIKYYLIGLCFAMPSYLNLVEKKWLLKRILILAIGLSFFSTIVADSRNEYSGSEVYSQNFENPVLSALSGGIEYAGAHYYGFQLRNMDTYDENNLGLGYFTFYSIFDLSLPLSNYHAINGTLGNFFGFKENPIDYFYLWENDSEGYFTTNSVYLDLKLDFGFYGTLIFLFLFTFYTQYLFLKIEIGKNVSIYTMFWFMFCFEFWAASNFKSSYATGFIGGIIMTILFSKYFILNKQQ